MENMLEAPITRLGIADVEAAKLSEALNIKTVKDMAMNQHFLLAQNLYLMSVAGKTAGHASTEKKQPFLELISSITGATVLLAALLYVAGWSYLYQYYKGFGLRISELNLPLYDALTYSLTVIFSSYRSVFWAVLLTIIVSTVLSLRWVSERLVTPVGVCLFLVAILGFGSWLSHKGAALGAEQVAKDMREEGSNLPGIQLDLAPRTETAGSDAATPSKESKTKRAPCVLSEKASEEDFDQPCYRLIIHANGQYYFFRPLKQIPNLPTSNLDVYVIPDSRVRRIYLQRGVQFSGGEK